MARNPFAKSYPCHIVYTQEKKLIILSSDSILFLLLSLFIIAASLYLPEHVSIIASRIAYYFSGNEDTFGAGVQKPGMVASDMGSNDILAQQQRMGAGAMAGPGRGFMEP